MKFASFVLFNFLLLFVWTDGTACTSFVVSGNETWYGMNFDYPEIDIRFAISETNGHKIFRTYFGSDYVCGMNEHGLFTNYQMLYYNNGSPAFQNTGNTLDFGSLNSYALKNFKSVNEIINYIGPKNITRSWNQDLHTLFADSAGNGIIVEPFGSYNGVVPIKNKFLVMTNLPHYDFINSDYTSVFGAGADRYRTAYKYILNNISTFGYENALETLRRTVQTSEYPTQVSLLFNPIKKEIFFCLKRDFSKVWKISLAHKTLETYSGFTVNKTESLNATGVWASALTKTSSSGNSFIGSEIVVQLSQNPAKDMVTLKLANVPIRKSCLRLYNLQGKCLFERKHFDRQSSFTIDLTGYPKGVYLLKLSGNGKIFTEKFCLE